MHVCVWGKTPAAAFGKFTALVQFFFLLLNSCISESTYFFLLQFHFSNSLEVEGGGHRIQGGTVVNYRNGNAKRVGSQEGLICLKVTMVGEVLSMSLWWVSV